MGAVARVILALLFAFAGAALPASAEQSSPPVTVPLPSGAVTIESCRWTGTDRTFNTDIKLADHTNLKIAKARLLLTYISKYGETVSSFVDMTGALIRPVDGMPPEGTWKKGIFPRDLQTLRCGLVGVKFEGYPNVIYSALKQ